MSQSFDVRTSCFAFGSVVAADVPLPLKYFPASGGAVSLVEVYFTAATAGTLGTLYLLSGSCATGATLGTAANCATLGTIGGDTDGTGGYAALVPYKFVLESPAVIPAGHWLAVSSNLAWNELTNNIMSIAYVRGR